MDANDSDDGATSDYGDSIATSEFTSVVTSRVAHHFEHGRRYQGFLQGRYGLPNDEDEQMREGVKHKLYVDYIFDEKLYLAPIGDNPQKIVDLGTGVGLWAQDVAEKHPSARVIGTDLSPIQPHWTPPNIEFRIEDLEDEDRPWTNIYRNADHIHVRSLLQTLRNPQRLLDRAFENLKPGGWVECHETAPAVFSEDGTVGDEHPFNRFYNILGGDFSTTYSWNLRIVYRVPEMLSAAGFINIQEKHTNIPIGKWHTDAKMREMGMFNKSICADFISAILAKYETMGLSNEEAVTLGHDLSVAFDNPRVHAMNDWISVWAQKPPEPPEPPES